MLPAVRSRPCACAQLEKHRHGSAVLEGSIRTRDSRYLYDENVRRRTVRSMRILVAPNDGPTHSDMESVIIDHGSIVRLACRDGHGGRVERCRTLERKGRR